MLFRIIDGHCDTMSKIYNSKSSLNHNNYHVDIKKLKQSNANIQFFAAFVDKNKIKDTFSEVFSQIHYFFSQIEENNNSISIARSYDDIKNAQPEEKIVAILSIEGGEAIGNDIRLLHDFYNLGVREIGLTWNYKNQIACGVYEHNLDNGLSSFGKSVIKEMNDLGMIIDVSHMAERSFWDVLDCSNTPVIASHSNSKKICDNIRNLSDSQIQGIASKKGLIGINFFPLFLNNSKEANIYDIINHIEYICSLVGVDHVAIGSDFDGIDLLPSGIKDYSSMSVLIDTMLKMNYNEQNIKKIFYQNYMRILKQIIS
ncbi:MAG: dipeptidase [Clostridia bacterium]|nr:dipeptidase [Clostridia bacterium]